MMDCTQKGRHWTMASYTIKHSVCYQNTTIVEIIHTDHLPVDSFIPAAIVTAITEWTINESPLLL